MKRKGESYLGGHTVVNFTTPGWFSSETKDYPPDYQHAIDGMDRTLRGVKPLADADQKIAELRKHVIAAGNELRGAFSRHEVLRQELESLLLAHKQPIDRYPEAQKLVLTAEGVALRRKRARRDRRTSV